jgi:gliding motility associated protien GldN
MRKILVLMVYGMISLILFPGIASGQDVLNGIYHKHRDKQRDPIPYKPLREADVMWGKFVIRTIDLREKQNLPLFYPTQPIQERMSLIDLLLHGIKTEGLTAYSADEWAGKEFDVPMTWADIERKFDAVDQTTEVQDLETGEYYTKTIPGQIYSAEVKQILVREMWFFDRKHSSLEVRIIGLCPVREFFKDAGGNLSAESAALAEEIAGEAQLRKVFWIEFAEARKLFANHEVFNPKNDAESRTFDDIFFNRKFSSYIVQESNVYDNRNINEYSLGQQTLLESERIRGEIFNYEQDLWEY